MSNMLEELWPAFVAEVSEQLESLELELLKTNIHDIDVRKLFRQFHTIKSSCGMLDFSTMEVLAHKAEDLLDELREGRATINADIVEALLIANDALKLQLAEAEESKLTPKANNNAEKKLSDILVKITGVDAEEENSSNVEEEKFDQEGNNAISLAETNETTPQQNQQVESYELELLSTIVRDHLINIVAKKTIKNNARIFESINQVQEACTALGYRSISSTLQKMESEYLKDTINQYAIISYVSDLLARMETLENSFHIDLSCQTCRKQVSKAYRKSFIDDVDAYVNELQALSAFDFHNKELLKPVAESILNSTFRLINFSRLFGIKEFTEYLNVSYQFLKKCVYDDADYKNLQSLSLSIREALYQQEFDHDVRRFLDYTNAQITGSAPKVKKNTKTNYFIEHETLVNWTNFISHSKTVELESFYLEGKGCIREIFVNFNSDKQLGESFVAWLYENVQVVTNISVFDENEFVLPIAATVAFLVMDFNPHVNDLEIESFDTEGDFLHQMIYVKDGVVESNNKQQQNKASQKNATLRINSKQLDRIVSQVGELVMARNSMAHTIYDENFSHQSLKIRNYLRETHLNGDEVAMKLMNDFINSVNNFKDLLVQEDLRIQSSVSRIQDEVLALRVVPMSSIFNRLPRLVHSLNKDLGKNVLLSMVGENEQIDKGLVDILMEPMLHLVRNAMDHGIEPEDERVRIGKRAQGTLTINAVTIGNTLRIEVSDDGRGLDKTKIAAKAQVLGLTNTSNENLESLIFLPGFSTSETITDTSGRGVGLDAVKASITNIGGSVQVFSDFGVGTRFVLSLPVTVAIQGVVLIDSEIQRFAIPERNVEEVVSFDVSQIQKVNGQVSYLLRDDVLPLFDLDKLVFPSRKAAEVSASQEATFLVLSNGKERIALVVSEIVGRQDIFVRDVSQELLNIPSFGGASVLGDGSVVIILDCDSLLALASQNAQAELTIQTRVLQ